MPLHLIPCAPHPDELLRQLDTDDAAFVRCPRCGEVVERGERPDGCDDLMCRGGEV